MELETNFQEAANVSVRFIEWNVEQIDSGGLEDWLLLSVKKEKMEKKGGE